MADDGCDELARQDCGGLVALRFGQVAFQDGLRRPLPEVRLEDGGQRESTSRPPPALAVSLRHRPRRP